MFVVFFSRGMLTLADYEEETPSCHLDKGLWIRLSDEYGYVSVVFEDYFTQFILLLSDSSIFASEP